MHNDVFYGKGVFYCYMMCTLLLWQNVMSYDKVMKKYQKVTT